MPRQPGDRRRARDRARPLWLAGITACVLVLVLGVAGLAGGLEEAAAPELPAAAVEAVVEAEPWNVMVAQAGVVHAEWAEPVRLRDEGNHWFVVIVEIEVTAPDSRDDVKEALVVRGIDGIEDAGPADPLPAPYDIRLARDSTVTFPMLHPGLPERLVFLWERGSDAPPPAEVEVGVVGMVYRESSVTGRMDWLDPQPVAQVTVPVVDRRVPPDESAEEEE